MTSNSTVMPVKPAHSTQQGAWWQNKRLHRSLLRSVFGLLAVAGAIIMFIPFLWMLSTSLKEDGDVFLIPIQWVPRPILWSNFPEALVFQPFFTYFWNSVQVTFLGVLGSVFTASLVAFAFARLRAPGKNFLFAILLATLMLPGEVTLVPIYLIFRQLHWLDTYLPLVIPSWLGGSAFYIFLLRQFFMTLPTELDDAAKIDGASIFNTYWRIIMPLSKPALASVAIFAFFSHWNNFQGALIYLTTLDKYTIPIGLRLYISTGGRNMHWNYLMAATLVSILPPILVFITSQRFFVEGAVLSGVKG